MAYLFCFEGGVDYERLKIAPYSKQGATDDGWPCFDLGLLGLLPLLLFLYDRLEERVWPILVEDLIAGHDRDEVLRFG